METYSKYFKSRCNKSRKIGHTSTDPNCMESKYKRRAYKDYGENERSSGKFFITYFNCGKTGHKKEDFSELFGSSNRAIQSFDKKESITVLCPVSETVCASTKEHKK